MCCGPRSVGASGAGLAAAGVGVAKGRKGESANQQISKHLHLRRSAAQVQVSANPQVIARHSVTLSFSSIWNRSLWCAADDHRLADHLQPGRARHRSGTVAVPAIAPLGLLLVGGLAQWLPTHGASTSPWLTDWNGLMGADRRPGSRDRSGVPFAPPAETSRSPWQSASPVGRTFGGGLELVGYR